MLEADFACPCGLGGVGGHRGAVEFVLVVLRGDLGDSTGHAEEAGGDVGGVGSGGVAAASVTRSRPGCLFFACRSRRCGESVSQG